MKKFFLALVAMFAITAVASAANYTADDAAIDAAIENAVQVNAFNLTGNDFAGTTFVAAGEKNDAIALVLTLFLGEFGIHRLYMGADKLTWLWYTLLNFVFITPIIVLVDLVVEIIGLVDGSGLSQYYDNPKLLMWL